MPPEAGEQGDLDQFGVNYDVPPLVHRKRTVTVDHDGETRLVGFVGRDRRRDCKVYTSRRSGYHYYQEGEGYAVSVSALETAEEVGVARVLIHEKDEPHTVYEFPLREYLDGAEVVQGYLADRDDPQRYVPAAACMNRWEEHGEEMFTQGFDAAMDRITSKRGWG